MKSRPALVPINAAQTLKEAQSSQTLKALLGLREMVLAGRIAPGERIVELNVVEQLGVSRTPVRAALARLHEEGLLDALPGGGYAVRRFSEDDVRDAIDLRGTLEGMAARLAAERGASPQQLQQAITLVDALDRTIHATPWDEARFAEYVALNQRFHDLLLLMAQSPVLARELQRIAQAPFAGPNAFVGMQGRDDAAREVLIIAQSQHRAAIEAIQAREASRAEALMREHARIAHRNLQRALGDHRELSQIPGGRLISRR